MSSKIIRRYGSVRSVEFERGRVLYRNGKLREVE